jgi:hypothetical protein
LNTTAAGYKLIKKIKDAKFDVENLHLYNLLLQVGVRDLQIVVIDSTNNRTLLMEDYVMASAKTYRELKDMLTQLFEDHHLLMAGFWKTVRVSVKNNKFSLVPSSLFVKEASEDYLQLNSKFDSTTENILYYKHIKSDAICVFAMNKLLVEWIKSLYPNTEVQFIHQSSALIEGAINFAKVNKKDSMYLYIDRFKLHIITLRNGQLEYYNQFAIKQFNDYIRYIMLVMKGLNRGQKDSDVVIWGYIGKESSHYKEFYRFIKNISFGDRPDYLKYGFVFDEVQEHHFFDLYSMHLCS